LTWLFFFLYGPVEDALAVYVAHDLRASAGLLGAYWTSFGAGALVAALIYGPFIPLTYALLQSSATSANLPAVLAARSAIIMVAAPLGTAAGGSVVGTFGAAQTLTASGAATVLLAVTTGAIWARRSGQLRRSSWHQPRPPRLRRTSRWLTHLQ
jgi:hypothetical protein